MLVTVLLVSMTMPGVTGLDKSWTSGVSIYTDVSKVPGKQPFMTAHADDAKGSIPFGSTYLPK